MMSVWLASARTSSHVPRRGSTRVISCGWFLMLGSYASSGLQCAFHVLENHTFGFRKQRQHDEELHQHHAREERKWRGAGAGGHDREYARDGGVHEPVREAAKALPLAANGGRKDLTEIDPDDCSLREGERGDESREQPHQPFRMTAG